MIKMKHLQMFEGLRCERRMECDKVVDPYWYTAMMKKQRLKDKSLTIRKNISF